MSVGLLSVGLLKQHHHLWMDTYFLVKRLTEKSEIEGYADYYFKSRYSSYREATINNRYHCLNQRSLLNLNVCGIPQYHNINMTCDTLQYLFSPFPTKQEM